MIRRLRGIISSTLAGTCAHLIPCFKHNMLQNHAEVLWEKKEFNKTQHDGWRMIVSYILQACSCIFLFIFLLHKFDWFLLIEAWPMYPRWGLKEAREMDPRVCVHIEDDSVLVPIWLFWWSSFWNSLLRLTIVLKATALQFTFETFVLVYMETLRIWITKFSSHQSVNESPLHTCSLDCSIDGIPPENSKTVTPPSVY